MQRILTGELKPGDRIKELQVANEICVHAAQGKEEKYRRNPVSRSKERPVITTEEDHGDEEDEQKRNRDNYIKYDENCFKSQGIPL